MFILIAHIGFALSVKELPSVSAFTPEILLQLCHVHHVRQWISSCILGLKIKLEKLLVDLHDSVTRGFFIKKELFVFNDVLIYQTPS